MFSLQKMFIAASLLCAATTYAQDSIELGHPATGGNGCPAGTVSSTLSPDGKQLSLIFDQFIAEAGPGVGRTMDRKSCNIAIPVRVPNGYSISIMSVDYRGFVSLPQGATAQISAEYFFAGMAGPRLARNFVGRQDTDYLFNNQIAVQAMVWSPCGADTNLRVNAGMMLRNSSWQQDAMATVDTTDISAGLVYHIQYRRCR